MRGDEHGTRVVDSGFFQDVTVRGVADDVCGVISFAFGEPAPSSTAQMSKNGHGRVHPQWQSRIGRASHHAHTSCIGHGNMEIGFGNDLPHS